ncbi:MAG: hypothetical protein JSS69_10530 [Acidobacteria bacterium]|nr:hypothetical protein [Acidobacteriota bacterium]MBS1866338.1 hypothetical protein [Acidobacteriota bacterium]
MMRLGLGLRAGAFCGLLACGIGGGSAMEKQGEVRHVTVPKAEARPEDVSTIEGIVKASYETISGGVGVPRQWGRDRTLFAPSVRYISIGKDKSGAVKARTSDYQEYLDESDDFLVKQGFTEAELGRKIEQFGNVATVLSSYEGRVASTGKVVTRGVNIFSLYYDGKRWWIQTMLWDEESPKNPIPTELLGERKR